MKKLYATLPLLLTGLSLYAQPKAASTVKDPYIANALQKQIASWQAAQPTTANKSTALKRRLVGYATRSFLNGNYVADSGRAFYSGSYGSEGLQHGFWSSYSGAFSAQAMYNRPLLFPDSVQRFYQQGSASIPVPSFWSGFAYTYNADTNVLTSIARYGGSPTATVNTYHSNGNLATSVTGTSLYRWFNTDGNVVRDSGATQETDYFYTGALPDSSLTTLRVATPYTGPSGITFNRKYEKTFSTFNANGYYTLYMSVAYDSLRTMSDTNTYYAASAYNFDGLNRLISYQYLSGASPSTTSLWKSDYAYAGNFFMPVDIRNSQFLSGNFVLQYRSGSGLNSNGDQDTLYSYWVNGGMDTLTEKAVVFRNTDGYIEKGWKIPYDAIAGTFGASYDSTLYFYETYNDPTGVGNTARVQVVNLCYPNPAQDVLHIVCKDAWTISDLSGKKIASGNVPYDLPLSGWPVGIYLLQTKDGYQKLVKE